MTLPKVPLNKEVNILYKCVCVYIYINIVICVWLPYLFVSFHICIFVDVFTFCIFSNFVDVFTFCILFSNVLIE